MNQSMITLLRFRMLLPKSKLSFALEVPVNVKEARKNIQLCNQGEDDKE